MAQSLHLATFNHAHKSSSIDQPLESPTIHSHCVSSYSNVFNVPSFFNRYIEASDIPSLTWPVLIDPYDGCHLASSYSISDSAMDLLIVSRTKCTLVESSLFPFFKHLFWQRTIELARYLSASIVRNYSRSSENGGPQMVGCGCARRLVSFVFNIKLTVSLQFSMKDEVRCGDL